MDKQIDILKGIHPGKIIARDLKKMQLSQKAFAESIDEHPQTINAIITGRRNLTMELSLKIEQALHYEEGFMLILQVYHDIAAYRQKTLPVSTEVPAIRKILFWDTQFEDIDWQKYKNAVIDRVLDRGNEAEKEEIARFYKIKRSDLEQFRLPPNNYRIKALINK